MSARKTYRSYGSVKRSENLNVILGNPKDREGAEFFAFATWHRERFREDIIFKPESRRLIAAYRFYLKRQIATHQPP